MAIKDVSALLVMLEGNAKVRDSASLSFLLAVHILALTFVGNEIADCWEASGSDLCPRCFEEYEWDMTCLDCFRDSKAMGCPDCRMDPFASDCIDCFGNFTSPDCERRDSSTSAATTIWIERRNECSSGAIFYLYFF